MQRSIQKKKGRSRHAGLDPASGKAKAPVVMPDPDPASRRRKEKKTTLDPRLKTSGMTVRGRVRK